MALLSLAVVLMGVLTCLAQQPSWMDVSKSPNERSQLILKEMTLEEKVAMLHGNSSIDPSYVGYIAGNSRLSIPALKMMDGPQG